MVAGSCMQTVGGDSSLSRAFGEIRSGGRFSLKFRCQGGPWREEEEEEGGGELTLYCVFTYFHRIPSTFHKIQRLYKGRRSQDASSTLYTFEFPRQRFPTPTPWQAVRVELEWRRALAPPFIPPRIGSLQGTGEKK